VQSHLSYVAVAVALKSAAPYVQIKIATVVKRQSWAIVGRQLHAPEDHPVGRDARVGFSAPDGVKNSAASVLANTPTLVFIGPQNLPSNDTLMHDTLMHDTLIKVWANQDF
jgi:hypothetical protein